MAPALSKSPGSGPLPRRLLAQYLVLLRLYPVLTKAASSAVLSALGSFLSQILEKVHKKKALDLWGPTRFAIFGFFFTGPLSHYFYLYLDRFVPSDVPFSIIKRLLLDRLVVAPAFLLLFFFVMNLLEGKDSDAFAKKLTSSYWTSLKMNWKLWTPVQFINLTYIPMQFQVLFGNLVALFWFAYLASVKK
ncbi:hypothetical protein JRQ81_007635 [Phrynocephalus forsythii]|uniref:Peroxisomal membrane protein 2 n=1 Tax=Phrynocephalus forsythii TaxID=171643 RepID=A0A9Q0XC67_9SAUR|nr:hypothetical protein JRQ81_007635 [Phrynocephalus forsythii]